MSVPGCFGTILQIFQLESKGVFGIFCPVLNLYDFEVQIDNPTPFLTGLPEPFQARFESLEFGERQHQ